MKGYSHNSGQKDSIWWWGRNPAKNGLTIKHDKLCQEITDHEQESTDTSVEYKN